MILPAPLPRRLHPGAWWIWALGLAAAATSTTNPLVLGLILAVVALVVVARQPPTTGPVGMRLYVALALIVITVRVLFWVVLGTGAGTTVLFTLPQLQLPEAVAGIRIGGPVTAEGLAAAFLDGLRLATLLVCVGAANVLADARRLLRGTPGALHGVATAVVLALTIAPQLVESVTRVRRARRLRGDDRVGLRAVRASLIPVLEDALDRSLALAGAMEARGYGRTTPVPTSDRRLGSGLLLGGLVLACVGVYGALDPTVPGPLRAPTLLLGAAALVAGVVVAGRHATRSRYRPDPWHLPEWATAASGLAAVGAVVATSRFDPVALHPSTNPLVWPALPALAMVGALLAALPAALTPSPTVREVVT